MRTPTKFIIYFMPIVTVVAINSIPGSETFFQDFLGKFGTKIYGILPNLTNVMITSIIIYILFGRNPTPKALLASIPKEEITPYFIEYMVQKYSIDGNGAEGYWDILNQWCTNKEYYENLTVFIALKGLPDSRGYRTLRIKVSYKVFNPRYKDLLRFCCKYSKDQQDTINDERYALSWVFVNNPADNCLPDNAFTCRHIKIGTESIKPTNNIAKDTSKEVEIQTTSPNRIDLHGKTVEYEFDILQYSGQGFINCHVNRLTNTYTVTLNYADASDISNVYAADFISSKERAIATDLTKQSSKTVSGWVAPNSVVSFSWTNI